MMRMAAVLKSSIVGLVSGIEPSDDLGRDHRRSALSWLAGTDDIFRRSKPRTPSPHLVSYFLPTDRSTGSVLLGDHRLSGLWLPPGGHVEPGEHPLDTVRREAAEELGVPPVLDEEFADKPFFLTMTETVGPAAARHVDVSFWFALAGPVEQPLNPDQREFVQVRWWTRAELLDAAPGRLEPHLLRALDALGLAGPWPPSEGSGATPLPLRQLTERQGPAGCCELPVRTRECRLDQSRSIHSSAARRRAPGRASTPDLTRPGRWPCP